MLRDVNGCDIVRLKRPDDVWGIRLLLVPDLEHDHIVFGRTSAAKLSDVQFRARRWAHSDGVVSCRA